MLATFTLTDYFIRLTYLPSFVSKERMLWLSWWQCIYESVECGRKMFKLGTQGGNAVMAWCARGSWCARWWVEKQLNIKLGFGEATVEIVCTENCCFKLRKRKEIHSNRDIIVLESSFNNCTDVVQI